MPLLTVQVSTSEATGVERGDERAVEGARRAAHGIQARLIVADDDIDRHFDRFGLVAGGDGTV